MRGSAWLVCTLLGLGCSRVNPLYGDDDASASGKPESTSEGVTSLDTGRTDATSAGTRGMGGTDGSGDATGTATMSLDGPITTTGADGPLDTGFSDTGVAETGVAETGTTTEQCCMPHPDPGCEAPSIDMDCVCINHPACCNQGWHLGCVAAAVLECGLPCESPAPNSCCDSSLTPGCIDWGATACVCDISPLCCLGPWTEACASTFVEGCGGECAA